MVMEPSLLGIPSKLNPYLFGAPVYTKNLPRT